MEEIKKEVLESQLKEYQKSKVNSVLRHALSKTAIGDVVHSQDGIDKMDFNFDINIKTMPVTNQKASGRCWIFAASNVMREVVAKKCNLVNFEISQSYLAFFDKLEKINYTLEAIIELIKSDADDRTLAFLLQNGIGDGGQWDMIVSVVDKYGFCPKNVFPETFASSNTWPLNSLINASIRQFAARSKDKKSIKEIRKLKEEMMKKFYFLLVDTYGVPPKSFDFEYTDKDGKYHLEKGLTPQSFAKEYLGEELHDYVSLINAPTKDKPYGKTFNIKYLGNVVGGKQVTHLNLPMERLKELILAQLKDGRIVWFGSDVGCYGDRTGGYWDDGMFDYASAFGLDFKMDKGESLDFRASAMNHAMCITGVALKGSKPTKWKIENSWGDANGQKGYYMMSASWFDQYTYQAVVDKKYLSSEELKALKGKPIELKPWDPMGSLAK